jgi:hypothetical protein
VILDQCVKGGILSLPVGLAAGGSPAGMGGSFSPFGGIPVSLEGIPRIPSTSGGKDGILWPIRSY